MGSTPSVGPGSPALPGANCAIAYIHSFLLMVGFLTRALMNNGERTGEAGLLVSEILRHLSHKDMAFFVFCGHLSRIIHPN